MKFIIDKKNKSDIPSTKLYDLGTPDSGIDDLLDASIIYIDQNTIPVLLIDGTNYLINNFNPRDNKEDFEILLYESDLMTFGSSGGVSTVSGHFVNNSDPQNPVIDINNASSSFRGVMTPTDFLKLNNLPVYATNNLAGAGGVPNGGWYKSPNGSGGYYVNIYSNES